MKIQYSIKLLLILLGVALALAISSGFSGFQVLRTERLNESRELQLNGSRYLSSELEQSLQKPILQMIQLAQSTLFRQSSTNENRDALERRLGHLFSYFFKLNPEFNSGGLIDVNGEPLFVFNSDEYQVGFEDWYIEEIPHYPFTMMTDTSVTAKLIYDDQVQKYILVLFTKIVNDTGEIFGTLFITYDLSFLNQFLQSTNAREAWIVDYDSRLLATSSDAPPDQDLFYEIISKDVIFQPHTAKYQNTLSGNFLVTSSRIRLPASSSEQWTVIEVTPRSEVLAYVYRGYLLYSLTIIIPFILISFIGSTYLRRYNRPLNDLIKAAQTFGNQNWEAAEKLKPIKNDEIGQLTAAFKEMASQIKLTVSDLESSKERAEASSKAKTEFLQVISHELRTPLNQIINFPLLVKEDYELSAQAELLLDKTSKSGQHLLNLIDDIIEYVKFDSSDFQLNSAFLRMDHFINIIRDSSVIGLKKEDVTFDMWIDPAIPRVVMCDERYLHIILLKVLENAFKFTDKGNVSLRCDSFMRMGSHFLRFSVSDTGIGINAEDLKEIFNPFKQVDMSLSRKYGGTGMGLAVAYKLAQLMGGDIMARKRDGGGSVFVIEVACKLP